MYLGENGISQLIKRVKEDINDVISKFPTALKNPHALTFTGGVTGSYDGSSAKSVEIPKASSTVPKTAGTATTGTENNFARGDHVHPKQTDVANADMLDGKHASEFINCKDGGSFDENASLTFVKYFSHGDYRTDLEATGIRLSYNSNYEDKRINISGEEFKLTSARSYGIEEFVSIDASDGQIIYDHGNSEIHPLRITIDDGNDKEGGVNISVADLSPQNTDETLGRDNAWDSIYANTGTIITSDRTKKNTIEYLDDEKAKKFTMGLKPVTYKINSGTSGRTHWGLISQDVEELLERINMDGKDFAGLIKLPKTVTRNTDESGNPLEKPITETIDGEYDYSLRYDEFLAPIIKVIQMQQTEIENLKKDKLQLEERTAELEKVTASVLDKLASKNNA